MISNDYAFLRVNDRFDDPVQYRDGLFEIRVRREVHLNRSLLRERRSRGAATETIVFNKHEYRDFRKYRLLFPSSIDALLVSLES